MRHNEGSMGKARKLQVFDLLRCKARGFCSINPAGKGQEFNEKGQGIIRLTLLMRRGSRSFKNATAVTEIFAKECAMVDGCVLKVVQSEDLSFCDQVRVILLIHQFQRIFIPLTFTVKQFLTPRSYTRSVHNFRCLSFR